MDPVSPLSSSDALAIQDILLHHYGMEAHSLRKLPGEYDLNVFLRASDSTPFLLKISPPGTALVDLAFQHSMMEHLAEKDAENLMPTPVKNLWGDYSKEVTWKEGIRIIHLLHWVPGKPLAEVKPQSEALLESLGQKLGNLTAALEDFDHPGAHRRHDWDLVQTSDLLDAKPDLFDGLEKRLVKYFHSMFRDVALPLFPDLPKAVNYNDANDWNVLVSDNLENPEVSGFIDFGDAVHTVRISELAIALAYAIMDKPDPLASAVTIIRAYHSKVKLTEDEVDALFPLIAARLLISVVHAEARKEQSKDNPYLQISRDQAWGLLRKLADIPPMLARAAFRSASGYPAHHLSKTFLEWAASNTAKFHLVLDFPEPSKMGWIDLSIGSTELGNNPNFEDADRFERHLNRLMEDRGISLAMGGWQEVRPLYTTEPYKLEGPEGPDWRTLHLGMDLWQAAGSPIYAPLDGIIHSLSDNAGERNYGPTIILKHEVRDDLVFYTLYGHLDQASLEGKKEGDSIQAGQYFAAIGPRPENGNWPPHLHWQIMLDLFDASGDFPGVGFYRYREMWKDLCPDPALLLPLQLCPKENLPEKEKILNDRKQLLGKNLSLSYRAPLYILRGYLQHLYDHTGRRYLDTVNNVAHVGHEHRELVRAIREQAAVLNTNTRYIHPLLTRYAEALLSHFPSQLEVVYLVNSGSEANELALRMARTATGRKDIIAMREGYHGNTGACVDVSSYKFDGKGGSGAPATTLLLNMPDPLRGSGEGFKDDIEALLVKMQTADRKLAAFISESILSCGGQVVLPDGFLKKVYSEMRKAGALCIADEVQTGFGRIGTHMWAFEAQGATPDIVTLGKPIGNGHPLAAVITTRAVAEAFDNSMEYFNTFGGNPVSCAAGLAVLRVMENEGLRENALSTGAYLRKNLLELQEIYPIIGQVRGPGLFQGVELIKDPESLEQATEQGAYLINRMRLHGILMSTDGPFDNVLKIKPPMVFGKGDVDFLIGTLDKVLQEDFLTM